MTGGARYAQTTAVPAEQTRREIERVLKRYGADAFGYVEDGGRVGMMFRAHGRHIRFALPLPNSQEYRKASAYQQIVRQRWRALLLVIKAKLEAVASGISVFEDEFLANIVLPDGKSVGDFMRPQIESAYRDGTMPPRLPYYGPS